MNLWLSTVLIQPPNALLTKRLKNGIANLTNVEETQTQNPDIQEPKSQRRAQGAYPVDACAGAEDGVENRPPAPAPNGDDPMAAPLDCAPAAAGVPKIDIAHHRARPSPQAEGRDTGARAPPNG